ncbi:MAG TPA: hypothetical protein VHN14_15125 [Kofleriaceae bacterium]|jgi:hypothetical protein|nr:hypothetical protein [Kofleriaceae bacterium]
MRDEQVRRYARHILLPDVGGLGQTALMVSTAKLELHEREPLAELLAAHYLAAGGVGNLVIHGATEAQLADIAAHGSDTKISTEGTGRDLSLSPRPAWWPGSLPPDGDDGDDGDATALAFWRGGMAALSWMADIANR